MLTELNQKMKDAQQGIFRLQKIDAMLTELKEQQSLLSNRTDELKDILEKEDLDVKKLDGRSLAHIFYSVLGVLQEHAEKEQQEALAAQLKYNQAVLDLNHINDQINKLNIERSQYISCRKNYQDLYNRKKEILMESNSSAASRLMELTEQRNILNNTRKELREAIEAGEKVSYHLNNTLNSLNSAEGWGTWDLFGGGLLTDLAKHSHLDEAKAEAENTQLALQRFRTELADIRINSDIHIETDGFAKFADFFFDGLIADWCMQTRIHDSQDSVENVKNQVMQVMIKLQSMDSEAAARVEQLESEINELIEKAN